MSMIGADGSGMAIGTGHETDRVGPGSRGRERGSVMIEFAFSFPIVLVLFAFAWQMINMYKADIIGSYAAFAAARSYSVFRYADGFSDEDAVLLARDVAAVAMGALTPHAGKASGNLSFFSPEDMRKSDWLDEIDEVEMDWNKVSGFIQNDPSIGDITDLLFDAILGFFERIISSFMDSLIESLLKPIRDKDGGAKPGAEVASAVMRPLGYSSHAPAEAWRRMNRFRIVEYSSGAPKLYTIADGGTVESQTMDDALDYYRFTVPLAEGYTYLVNNDNSEAGLGTHARIAQVSFTYRLPLWLGFVHMSPHRRATDEQRRYGRKFALYQSSAAPIEPPIEPTKREEADLPEDRTEEMEVLETDLLNREKIMRHTLNDLRAKIRKVYDTIYKSGDKHLNRSKYPTTLLNAPILWFGPPWSNDNPVENRPEPATISPAREKHPAFTDLGLANFHNIYLAEVETGADVPASGQASLHNADEPTPAVMNWATDGVDPPLLDIKKLLYDEFCYRKHLMERIDYELERIKRVEDEVTRRANAIARREKLSNLSAPTFGFDEDGAVIPVVYSWGSLSPPGYPMVVIYNNAGKWNSDRVSRMEEWGRIRGYAESKIGSEHTKAGYRISDANYSMGNVANYRAEWEERKEEQQEWQDAVEPMWEEIFELIEQSQVDLKNYYGKQREIKELLHGDFDKLRKLLGGD
jgi:hypothetical protein